MKNFPRLFVVAAILLFFAGFVLVLKPVKISSQEKPLTYKDITLGLNPTNNPFKTKAALIKWLVDQIKKRKVDKPLTPEREELLRDAGATDEVIEAVRENSPSPGGTVETPTPNISTPTPTPTPVITPSPTIKPIVTPTPTGPKINPSLMTVKNSLGMEFVQLPAGTFIMGSPTTEVGRIDNEVPHKVTITKDFFMSKFEVTQAQWQAVMGSNPSFYSGAKCGDNCPVDWVSWNDVQELIVKLNAMGMGSYRLPTEAEWEYAARAGKDGEPFGIGNGKDLSSDLANFRGDYPYGGGEKNVSLERPVPVGSYQPNAWGLFDMHGNVREWCSDWYAEYYTNAPNQKDPKGPVVGIDKVSRGGGFTASGSYLRSAQRYRWLPMARNTSIGFRLVKEN